MSDDDVDDLVQGATSSDDEALADAERRSRQRIAAPHPDSWEVEVEIVGRTETFNRLVTVQIANAIRTASRPFMIPYVRYVVSDFVLRTGELVRQIRVVTGDHPFVITAAHESLIINGEPWFTFPGAGVMELLTSPYSEQSDLAYNSVANEIDEFMEQFPDDHIRTVVLSNRTHRLDISEWAREYEASLGTNPAVLNAIADLQDWFEDGLNGLRGIAPAA
jgi:hypothetical protein